MKFLAVDVNTQCHYRCYFCSARAGYPSRGPVRNVKHGLTEVLSDLSNALVPLQVIWVSGLEPLYDANTAHRIVEIRDAIGEACLLGITTAGARLKEFAGLILENVDFVNVSVDGLPHTADRIRGPGSFERAYSGMARLLEISFPVDRVVPSAVATIEYLGEVPELARLLKKGLGIQRFSVNLLEDVVGAGQLSNEKFAASIAQLSQAANEQSLDISVSCSALSVSDLFGFLDCLEERDLHIGYREDQLGFPECVVSDRCSIRLEYTPLIYGSVAKIDAYGWLLARPEDIHPYLSEPIGNILSNGPSVIRDIYSPTSPGMLQIRAINDVRWTKILGNAKIFALSGI